MLNDYVIFKDVVREYQSGHVNVRAADGISFHLDKGKFSIIVGPSGAGKTTVLNILGGMDSATSGSVYVDGRDITCLSKRDICTYRRNDVGFVFQFYNLIPNLTALENVELGLQICSDALDPHKILSEVGLDHRLDNFPAQLSGGEQQRVAIARALAKNPKLLLCDEPTGALDFSTGLQVLRLLRGFNVNYKKTVVVITHNAGIGGIADRVFYIKDGLIDRIVENETPLNPEQVSW